MNAMSLSEGKERFVELVANAANGKPQVIIENGVEVAVIISYDEYLRLSVQQNSLVSFLLNSPLRGSNLDLTRDKSLK